MSKLSNKKFSSLSAKRQHKHAARLLREIVEGREELDSYRPYEKALKLPAALKEKRSLLERLDLHEQNADIPYANQYQITTDDKESNIPFLEIDIYLEDLRSMHNIGAILRSNEAFRLGKIYLSKELPTSALEKIRKTAMGAEKICPLHIKNDITKLKRPLIAIETAENGSTTDSFVFPTKCTLLFGNEKRGLSKEVLSFADEIVSIPLFGNKNSLNVATAFAIIANTIRKK
ncbi:hypothetical protein K0U07_04160 [bacterium]|nr:hypothetical protein [bacterium]